MKFTQAVALWSIVIGTQAAAVASRGSSQGPAMQKRGGGCQAPGAHTCAVITAASLSSLGLPGSTVGSEGATVVDGGCNGIISSGDLQRNSPGFSADFKLVYGTDLYYGADSIGIDEISGVRFQYEGNSYTQDNCFDISSTDGPSATSAIQCNFAC